MADERICYRELEKYKYQLLSQYTHETHLEIDQDVATVDEYVRLTQNGTLTLKDSYAWDGPSGPTIDTKDFMRGSLVHYGLYQLMRDGLIDHEKYRKDADQLLKSHLPGRRHAPIWRLVRLSERTDLRRLGGDAPAPGARGLHLGSDTAPDKMKRINRKEIMMKKVFLFLIACVTLVSSLTYAQSATEKEVTQAVIDADAYLRAHLTDSPDAYSKLGALEFWSSGGLMQELGPGVAPEEYDAFNVHPKHIQVIPLVEGQAAVALFYSEGSLKPKGSAAVDHYMTRVMQVLVKEDGKWKVRASHFSPLVGGAGTTQTTMEP